MAMSAIVNEIHNQSDVSGVTMIEPVRKLLDRTNNNKKYRQIMVSVRYNDFVARKQPKMTKKTCIEMNNQMFRKNYRVSVIAFFQDFMSAYVA